MVIATRADVDTRSNIVRLPDADTSKKGYKFTDPDGEFPRVVPLPVQGDKGKYSPPVQSSWTPVPTLYLGTKQLYPSTFKMLSCADEK